MKKGFSLVELIVSIALLSIVVFMLFEIIVIIKNLYTTDGVNTELLLNQSNLSYNINKHLNDKKLKTLTTCGTGCVTFTYQDDTTENLVIDQANTRITFGKNQYTFPSKTTITSINSGVDLINTEIYYNAILHIQINIENKLFKDKNYGVTIVYPYNSAYTNVYDINL